MKTGVTTHRTARSAEEVHVVLQDAFNRGDIDALVGIYEDDATLVVPAGGCSARGRMEIRAMMAPVLALRPHMMRTVVKTLVGDGWALTHAGWEITGSGKDDTTLSGCGTVVCRCRSDGTWGIVVDDPMSPG
jgi:ketosteroid isomerase-like protein